MIKITLVEDGKPIVGLGVEYSDWEALKAQKKTFVFEIGGQTVHVGYVESKEKLAERIQKQGLSAKITAQPEAQALGSIEEKVHVPGKNETTTP